MKLIRILTLFITASAMLTPPSKGGEMEAAARASAAAFENTSTFWKILNPRHWRKKRKAKSPQAAGIMAAPDELMKFLDDPDPDVRIQAAKDLRNYAYTVERVRQKLLDVLDRNGELDSVRREVVKSLSRGAVYLPVKHRLIDAATHPRESSDIRAIALKSLYPAANHLDVRDALIDMLRPDPDLDIAVRRGAAWGLFGDYQDPTQHQALVRVAEDKDEPIDLRVEAIKSIAPAMAYYDAQFPVFALAQDKSLDTELRKAAILSFAMIRPNEEESRFLGQTARNDPDPVLRESAREALGGLTKKLAIYFHLTFFNGEYLDPLANQ